VLGPGDTPVCTVHGPVAKMFLPCEFGSDAAANTSAGFNRILLLTQGNARTVLPPAGDHDLDLTSSIPSSAKSEFRAGGMRGRGELGTPYIAFLCFLVVFVPKLFVA
jgi:hypothetical protein